jgi:mannose-6-phosphate isomerase
MAEPSYIEPGHQFEWSWLLARWSVACGRKDAFEVARWLAEIGEMHGVDRDRGVAVNALDARLAVSDPRARLWPQTERIKAWNAMSVHPSNSPNEQRRAAALVPLAIAGLQPYLAVNPAGLWYEIMTEDGGFLDEPVKASSLYHLTCAAHAVASTAGAAEERT